MGPVKLSRCRRWSAEKNSRYIFVPVYLSDTVPSPSFSVGKMYSTCGDAGPALRYPSVWEKVLNPRIVSSISGCASSEEPAALEEAEKSNDMPRNTDIRQYRPPSGSGSPIR